MHRWLIGLSTAHFFGRFQLIWFFGVINGRFGVINCRFGVINWQAWSVGSRPVRRALGPPLRPPFGATVNYAKSAVNNPKKPD